VGGAWIKIGEKMREGCKPRDYRQEASESIHALPMRFAWLWADKLSEAERQPTQRAGIASKARLNDR
jgi:hypothetical protein